MHTNYIAKFTQITLQNSHKLHCKMHTNYIAKCTQITLQNYTIFFAKNMRQFITKIYTKLHCKIIKKNTR